jgi:hypothetical protein
LLTDEVVICDQTYAVPQHYLYELAVHTRYCPLDTKFAIEPSQPGTGCTLYFPSSLPLPCPLSN